MERLCKFLSFSKKEESRNSKGELVYRYKFKHYSVDQSEVNRISKDYILLLCVENNIRAIIVDCDNKFHAKTFKEILHEGGVFVYYGAGKTAGEHVNGIHQESHEFNPCETFFANAFGIAQEDLERREKNRNKTRTMAMWRNAIKKTFDDFDVKEIRKIINRQPMIAADVCENGGARTKF